MRCESERSPRRNNQDEECSVACRYGVWIFLLRLRTRPVCVRGRGLHKYVCVPVRTRPCATRSLEMAHRLSLIRTVQRHDTGAAVSPGAAGGSGESAAKGARRVQARTCLRYSPVVRGRSSCNEPPRSSSRQRSPVHCIRHFARPRMRNHCWAVNLHRLRVGVML